MKGTTVVRYLLLYGIFIALFLGALLGVERIEGYKITTTEYYGMMNIGGIYIAMMFILTAAVYPVLALPVTVAANRWLRHPALQAVLFAGLSLWAGLYHYNSYGDYFIEGYGLAPWSSIGIFAAAGLLYTAANIVLGRLADRAEESASIRRP
ncbi:hypothetical protein [Paenibacillus humicus]|uniref:hypothetical protein n=1 Tax=Paenibacillus humicus TaxID=412861 RepID=UPI003F149DF6